MSLLCPVNNFVRRLPLSLGLLQLSLLGLPLVLPLLCKSVLLCKSGRLFNLLLVRRFGLLPEGIQPPLVPEVLVMDSRHARNRFCCIESRLGILPDGMFHKGSVHDCSVGELDAFVRTYSIVSSGFVSGKRRAYHLLLSLYVLTRGTWLGCERFGMQSPEQMQSGWCQLEATPSSAPRVSC